MGIENRPYVGTWRLGRQQVVQHTPDCLVYLNGDTSLPGCARCNSRINIQEFVTEVSVDAGTDAGATSASFTLSVPVHHHESFARDAQFILRPGLEVHIYQRGYFPVEGLFYQVDDANTPAYPYYHVFHGVITQVGGSYSTGVQTFSIQCGSMLHFWQFQQVSTNASIYGQKPDNSHNKVSDVGHNYTGKHPYEIIWNIHNDFISAAAGVGHAIQSQTNIGVMYGDKSLYSYTAKYWEERFRNSTVRLRMHGATGQLFNASQAAFLGRASSTELLKLTKSRFNQSNTGSKTGPSPFSSDTIRGSFTPDVLSSLLFLNKASANQPLGLNVVDMQAFISDVGQFGQYNFFESSYESKLDIANKVCEVTGFEFYQDVDGDFVFKPPFYNLDTSSSRTYRIEDIDIININFDEKEPEVTYMTAKGGSIKNTAAGVENEWGVRGQYIDYRLVAQYGWRPGEFETSYFNDKDAMQHAAANRLDILNAPSKSATVTIPLRPELRPGFPVYIASLDCFYYCSSFSHAYVVGGQCTTTLQLIAKRAKFFAPGDSIVSGTEVEVSGIDAIHLDNPSMPPRPLQVEDNMGYPKLMGFPNVVMALDPLRVDPRMLLAGGDIFDVSNPRMIPGIIQMALDKKIINYADKSDSGNVFEIQTGPNKNLQFYCDMDLIGLPLGVHPYTKEVQGLPNLASGADEFKRALEAANEAKKQRKKDVQKALLDLTKASNALMAIPNTTANATKRETAGKKVVAAEKKVAVAQDLLKKCNIAFYEKVENLNDDYKVLKILYTIIQDLISPTDGSRPDINSTNFILGILADKKASRTNGALPGAYRYYSASHPDPKHQGMPYLRVDLTKDSEGGFESSDVTLENSPIEGEGFLAGGPQSPLNKAVDAVFGDIWVSNGIQVLDGDPEKRGGVVVPTSEIRDLMFSPATFKLDSARTTSSKKMNVGALTSSFFAALTASAVDVAKTNGTDSATLDEVFSSWVEKLSNNIQTGAEAVAPTVTKPGTLTVEFVDLRGAVVSLQDTPQMFKLVGTDGSWAFPGSSQKTVEQFWVMVAKNLVNSLKPTINENISVWRKAVLQSDDVGRMSARKDALSQFFVTLQGQYGNGGTAYTQRILNKKQKNINLSSPVFPVSDARGYEVVGSYRYGRGVDIDPNGVFAQLVNQGPLQRLDTKSVDTFVNDLMRNTSKVSYAQAQELLQGLFRAYPEDGQLGTLLQHYPPQNTEGEDNTYSLVVGLRSWYMDSVKDGVAKAKIQLTNAAYTLADLKPESLQICHCKMAEANILLESAQEFSFVPVVEGFAELEEQDPATAASMKSVAAAGGNWRLHQEALRGTIEPNLGGLIQSISEIDETLEAANRATQENVNEFVGGTVNTAREAAENVDDTFGGDGEV